MEENGALKLRFPAPRNFFAAGAFCDSGRTGRRFLLWGEGYMRDKNQMNQMSGIKRGDDGLGSNSDIGNKLRALYGAVQEEGIPSRLLELLEKLDEAEKRSTTQKDA